MLMSEALLGVIFSSLRENLLPPPSVTIECSDLTKSHIMSVTAFVLKIPLNDAMKHPLYVFYELTYFNMVLFYTFTNKAFSTLLCSRLHYH